MELWKQAIEYRNRAFKTTDRNEKVELFDKATSLYLQAAKRAKTEKSRLNRIGNARMMEANKCIAHAGKSLDKANASSGSEQAEYLREAAIYQLSAYSSRKEAAEIAKVRGNIASHHNRIGLAYKDQAYYHYYLAWAYKAVLNWDEALLDYRKSLELLETALEYYNRSLRIKFSQRVDNNRKKCIERIERRRSNILEVESKTTGVKTTGTPSLSVDLTADNLRQDMYSPVMLRIVNKGDGVAKDVKIRLGAPVEGETTASLETMKQESETGLALSVKPLEHGRMKFRKPPAAQQVFHIANFAGEIGRDEQIAGGDIVGGGRTR